MPELPTGTVTFLFTDIEGSTRLVQRLGDRWPQILAEHGLARLALSSRSAVSQLRSRFSRREDISTTHTEVVSPDEEQHEHFCRPVTFETKGTSMRSYRRVVLVVLGCALAATLASTGSAIDSVTRQRVAITEKANVDDGGNFELIPLTQGLLKQDVGSVTLAATVKRSVIRGGLQVVPVIAVSTMTSKLGTFKLTQTIYSVELSGGYSSDRGTWKFSAGTGAYAGYTGSGSFAAVGIPGGAGLNIIRQEGFMTKA